MANVAGKRGRLQLARSSVAVALPALVDADDAASAINQPSDELMTESEHAEFDQLQQQALAQPADASNLVLSPTNLERARQVREAFASRSDGDPAEELLEELIAGEIGVGHQLQDLEGVATALLGRTIMEPELALHVVRVAREIAALNSAVRRRTENSLNAVAGLRAQRLLLAVHRDRHGG